MFNMHQELDKSILTKSLDNFQTAEQRRVLDTISNVRKCGLDSLLSLPQIVVCGDQSSGKSSVLEALTEIPFPRNDNLCTRFATEIILRRKDCSSLTIWIIPDQKRPLSEKAKLKSFNETITNFEDLPRIVNLATVAMGVEDELSPDSQNSAFSRDVLSITMEGPNVPQLTLVDIPGLIANATMGVSEADVEMVGDITNHYISQSRTICLAVISATNDHANQSIVTRIKKYDPHGDRTLGVITKPDRLEVGSASEKGFIALAQNKDINYKLGWHVLKNRSHAETNCSLEQRNILEMNWLKQSNFSFLSPEKLGIEALRERLSRLLFEHVKNELPKLRQELEDSLKKYRKDLAELGQNRATPTECRSFLTQLSQNIRENCKLAIDGQYQGEFFHRECFVELSDIVEVPISRIRAVIQGLNSDFANMFRGYGHKYNFLFDKDGDLTNIPYDIYSGVKNEYSPISMNRRYTYQWISGIMARSRGKELQGNFNPILVGELFWEQSSKWKDFAIKHLDKVYDKCSEFLDQLLRDKCPKDVKARLWSNIIIDKLEIRKNKAFEELDRLNQDLKAFPINYNESYSGKINEKRRDRLNNFSKDKIRNNNAIYSGIEGEFFSTGSMVSGKKESCETNAEDSDHEDDYDDNRVLIGLSIDKSNLEEVFDSLVAIYEIQREVYIANITTQVVERHIVRGLESIFDPIVVGAMTDQEIDVVAREPTVSENARVYIQDRITRLEEANYIFKGHGVRG